MFWVCPNCKSEEEKQIVSVVKGGFNCKKCSDKTSMPERTALCFLDTLGIKYEYQKVFNDFTNRIFDFYIPELNIAIEMNGEQHYKKNSIYNYNRVSVSDKDKEKYCKNKNIKLYFINCKVVNVNKIIEDMSSIPEFKMYEVSKVRVKNLLANRNINNKHQEIAKLYEEGYSTNYIAEIYNMSKGGVNNILQRVGSELRNTGTPYKKVKCLNNNKVFNSITEATRYAGLKNTVNICDACKGKQKSAGKHPETGERLMWKYHN